MSDSASIASVYPPDSGSVACADRAQATASYWKVAFVSMTSGNPWVIRFVRPSATLTERVLRQRDGLCRIPSAAIGADRNRLAYADSDQ